MTAATQILRHDTLDGRARTALPTLASAIEWLFLAIRVSNERRTLAELGADRLEDLGLQTAEVHRETGRAFWDLPLNRKS